MPRATCTIVRLVPMVLGLAVVASVLAGCGGSSRTGSTTGGAGAAAADGLVESASLIRLGQTRLETALQSLETIVAAPADGIEPAYRQYVADLEALERVAERIASTNARMQAEGSAYFEAWDAQIAAIENVAIRDRSAERRRFVERSLSGLSVDYGRLAERYGRLITDLRDVRTALGLDLTAGGVAALADPIRSAVERGRAVETAATSVANTFAALGATMGAAPAG